MTHDEREAALEKIADLFNSGLSDLEVLARGDLTATEMIGLVRHLMMRPCNECPSDISEALAQMHADELGRVHP